MVYCVSPPRFLAHELQMPMGACLVQYCTRPAGIAGGADGGIKRRQPHRLRRGCSLLQCIQVSTTTVLNIVLQTGLCTYSSLKVKVFNAKRLGARQLILQCGQNSWLVLGHA